MRAVGHVPRQRSNLVQRRRESHKAVPGNASISRLHADDAAERSGLANRSARVGPQRPNRAARSHRRRAAAGASPWHAIRIPGIVCRMESGIFRGTAHRELVHICLAEDNRPLRLQFFHNRRVVRRHKILQHPGRTGCLDALRADIVLDGARNSLKIRNRLSGGNLLVGLLRFLQRGLPRNVDIRLDFIFRLVQSGEHVFRQLDRRYFFFHKQIMQLMRRLVI